jgi:hypothetical protein
MKDSPSSEILVADSHLSLIPAGEYGVMYHSHETRFVFGRKLIVHFTITENGMAGLQVSRFYNVQGFGGEPGIVGEFKVGKCCAFYREYLNLFDAQTPRPDRLSMHRFKHQPILAKVRVVTEANGTPLPKAAQYSVIHRLIRVIEE